MISYWLQLLSTKEQWVNLSVATDISFSEEVEGTPPSAVITFGGGRDAHRVTFSGPDNMDRIRTALKDMDQLRQAALRSASGR
jgi:hypothetical protein